MRTRQKQFYVTVTEIRIFGLKTIRIIKSAGDQRANRRQLKPETEKQKLVSKLQFVCVLFRRRKVDPVCQKNISTF